VCKKCQWQTCKAFTGLSVRAQIVGGGHPVKCKFCSWSGPPISAALTGETNCCCYFLTYVHVGLHSHSISFLIWCLSQCLVGDSGHPETVWRQHQHTEDNRVNARCSELLDLPGLWRSSSPSMSLEYTIKYARISTVSNISSGRSLSFYSIKKHHITWIFSWFFQIYSISFLHKYLDHILPNIMYMILHIVVNPSYKSHKFY